MLDSIKEFLEKWGLWLAYTFWKVAVKVWLLVWRDALTPILQFSIQIAMDVFLVIIGFVFDLIPDALWNPLASGLILLGDIFVFVDTAFPITEVLGIYVFWRIAFPVTLAFKWGRGK